MIYLYRDLVKEGYSDYKIKKEVLDGNLFMIDKGIYSTTKSYNFMEVICKKHPNAILTLETAAYCYGLIKEMPKTYYVATKQKDRKIKNENINQTFMSDYLYEVGSNKVKYLGFNIHIYDLERLLIEITRNKKNIPFESYTEIIKSYKKIVRLLNKNKLEKYLSFFQNEKIRQRIEKEVY